MFSYNFAVDNIGQSASFMAATSSLHVTVVPITQRPFEANNGILQ